MNSPQNLSEAALEQALERTEARSTALTQAPVSQRDVSRIARENGVSRKSVQLALRNVPDSVSE